MFEEGNVGQWCIPSALTSVSFASRFVCALFVCKLCARVQSTSTLGIWCVICISFVYSLCLPCVCFVCTVSVSHLCANLCAIGVLVCA